MKKKPASKFAKTPTPFGDPLGLATPKPFTKKAPPFGGAAPKKAVAAKTPPSPKVPKAPKPMMGLPDLSIPPVAPISKKPSAKKKGGKK